MAVAPIARGAASRELKEFRVDVRSCLTRWGDALFEIADAVLCSEGPVRDLAELSLVPEHARSHGSIQCAMNNGSVDFDRLDWTFALQDPPRGAGGGSCSTWTPPPVGPDADTREQGPAHFLSYLRPGRGAHRTIPGWCHSVAAALTGGPASWTGPLDTRHPCLGEHLREVTASQLRGVASRVVTPGRRTAGAPPMRIVTDCGYDGPYLAHQLAALPVEARVLLRGDRVRPCCPIAESDVGLSTGRVERAS